MNGNRVGLLAILLAYALTTNLAAQTGPQQPGHVDKELPWIEKLELAVQKKISFEAEATPLKEVAQKLAELGNVQIKLSRKIEDAGVQVSQPISGSYKDLALRSVLRNLLDDLNLTFMLKNEIVVITTVEDAQSPENLFARVYPVKDLLSAQGPNIQGSPSYEYSPLIQLIQGGIEPDSWGDGSHPGTIQGYENAGAIVVLSGLETHERIAQLLAALRKVKVTQDLPVKIQPAVKKTP